MKLLMVLIVLGVVAWLALQETETKTATKAEIVKQFESLPDCQNLAIAAGGQAGSAEDEIAASRKQLQDCLDKASSR